MGMAGLLRAVVLLLVFACSPVLAQQQVDANFQALLTALMQGSPVALVTPLANGTVQVTSFTAPGQRSAAEAAVLIERARINLSNLGVVQPTGAQLATALAGGTLNVPTGSTQITGALPSSPSPATVNTQIVTTAGLPLVVAPASPASPGSVTPGQAANPGQAAAGGSSVPTFGAPGTITPPMSTQPAPIITPLPPSSTPLPPSSTPAPSGTATPVFR